MSDDATLVAITVMGPINPEEVGSPLKVLPSRFSHDGFPLTESTGAGVPVAVML